MTSVTFFDTETNSKDDAHIIQITAINEKFHDDMIANLITEYSEYFSLPNWKSIDLHAMAVHHITNDFISSFEPISEEDRADIVDGFFTDSYIIAHNIWFDMKAMENDCIFPISCTPIDTLKIAKDILSEAEAYNLQYLRYYLCLKWEYKPHDSYDDVLLLRDIFDRLYDLWIRRESLEDSYESKMMFLEYWRETTENPVLLKKFTFWKHFWRTFEDVANSPDRSYLDWLYNSEMKKPEDDRNRDLIFTLRRYIW